MWRWETVSCKSDRPGEAEVLQLRVKAGVMEQFEPIPKGYGILREPHLLGQPGFDPTKAALGGVVVFCCRVKWAERRQHK